MEEGLLVATWWGGALAALFGLAGLVVGIVGLIQAKNARNSAADANVIAKDANAVARQVNMFAVDANGIARDSNALAEEANAITKREAERSAELHGIDWQTDWDTPGRYRVQNLGPDVAVSVRAQVTVDDETVSGEAEQLAKGEALTLEFPRALATYKREQQQRVDDKEWQRTQRETGLFGGRINSLPIMSNLDPLHGSNHLIRDLLTWRSPAGNPHKRDEQHRFSRLEP